MVLLDFIDDYIIVVQKNNEGLKPAHKFLLQSILAVVFFFLYRTSSTTNIWIPIFDVTIDLSWFYFILVFFMFTAETNAVNLTDGLDGFVCRSNGDCACSICGIRMDARII